MEYGGNGWRSRMVRGAAASEVERWLAVIETRPRLPGRASGKPLMWLHLAECPARDSDTLTAKRSIGVQPDVLRALDRQLSEPDLQALRGIFERTGEVFHGTVEFATPRSRP
jgi:hypothetical protein